ncbi:MAG: RNase adapter RapZ [Holosporales bacterium]|nr:RNase adapter RapZ [Holosporales bacterium]
MFPFVIITGLSGSGKSIIMKSLEDLGYETIDNPPLSLLRPAIEEKNPGGKPLAIGVDVRSRDFSPKELLKTVQELREQGKNLHLVFLESDDSVIERRYRETRRTHPLVEGSDLSQGIFQERLLLLELREAADFILDTSLLTPPEFKALVRERFSFHHQKTLNLHLMSFAFREGIPRESDMVFDMRFLKNPYYEPSLKILTGETPSVQSYLADDETFKAFSEHLKKMLDLILPPIEAEGRGYFIISFGCTGGQHRSVFTAEWMSRWLREKGYGVETYHREIKKL